MMRFSNILCIVLMVISLQSCFKEKAGVINLVTPEEAAVLIESDQVKIIDVRAELDFDKKHLKNAVNIEVENDDLYSVLDQMKKDEPLLVYCNKGGQSERCAQILKEKGFTLIYDMDGGIAKWEESGRQVIVKN
ncbi:rhodanese-like domain-containing protein [Nonlabens sp.]|uniref:rhodanese-like domain-containing protein n=1 Tax=Nonlabens sp. TaxID=1888209 RepID=UPI003F6962FF